uniref:DUF1618 domain-containing protein n=1 Tax=Oryza punctata TaxID=4537 RepID=A0A0E0MD14_ORYPU
MAVYSKLLWGSHTNDGATKPRQRRLQPKSLVSRMASPEEILIALEEIPGLARDDLLKASLLGLPMSLRKKWLLIEIKACRDCPLAVRWVMLEHYGTKLEVNGEDSDCDSNSNSGGVRITEATSHSTDGHVVRVSFRLEPPPAASHLTFHCSLSSNYGDHWPSMKVVAAHGDSVLVEMHYKKEGYDNYGIDYFVYNSGAGDGDDDPPRPPSLSLLPTYWVPLDDDDRRFHPQRQGPKVHELDGASTGLLLRRRCHGEDDLVVAELIITKESESESSKLEEAELLVLRSGEWSATRAPIIHDDGKAEELSYWETDMAVPVGDRRLCWVDLYRGIILCDLFDESPLRLQYVPLPVEAPAGEFDDDSDDENSRRYLMADRSVCVTDGGATLKFIDVFPRCCCGSPGATLCNHSRNAFVINTWTLRMNDDDDMEWTMDAIVDATELWSLDAYAGIPRITPEHPIVSIDDPDVICFIVPEQHRQGKHYIGETTWKMMMNTKNKTLLSVCRYDDDGSQREPSYGHTYIPSKISTLYRNRSSNNGATKPPVVVCKPSTITTQIDVNQSQSWPPDSSAKHLMQVSRIASPEEILVALEEIPDLACDDLLKAYSILCRDNGRLFRSLLGLPMGLRKKWLMIEIKAYKNIYSTSATLPNSGGPSPAGGGGYPQWVILAEHGALEDKDEDPNSCTTTADAAKITEAASHSSAGNHVGVFRCLPSGSSIGDRHLPSMRVVAVHRDSVLLRMQYRKGHAYEDDIGLDYFLYNAGGSSSAAADPPRLPLLSLLLTYWETLQEEEKEKKEDDDEEETYRGYRGWAAPKRWVHELGVKTTGILHRRSEDDDDLVKEEDGGAPEELLVLRSGGEWTVTRPPVVHDDGKAKKVSHWQSDLVVPSATRCSAGLICIAASSYVTCLTKVPSCDTCHSPSMPPPAKFDNHRGDYSINPRMCPRQKRSFWVSDDGDELRFIDMSPHCCCGDVGATTCDNARNAFVISSWTLRMSEMRWVMDAMVALVSLMPTLAMASHASDRNTLS